MKPENSYKEKQQNKLRQITQELLMTDVSTIKKLQESYEAGLHDRMSSLSISDTDAVREVHALIKGSRAFIAWVIANKKKTEG